MHAMVLIPAQSNGCNSTFNGSSNPYLSLTVEGVVCEIIWQHMMAAVTDFVILDFTGVKNV